LDIQNYPVSQFFGPFLTDGEASPPTGAVAGRFDIAEIGQGGGFDGDDSYLLACTSTFPANGNNFGSYCNPQVDALYQQELATPDPGLRQMIFD